jgi:hypothetical protein
VNGVTNTADDILENNELQSQSRLDELKNRKIKASQGYQPTGDSSSNNVQKRILP